MVPWWVGISIGLVGLVLGVAIGTVAGTLEPTRRRDDESDYDRER